LLQQVDNSAPEWCESRHKHNFEQI